jgi:hypothetical protein
MRFMLTGLFLWLTLTIAMASGKLPVYEAQAGNSIEKGDFLGCSLACAIGWTLKASSTLPPQGTSNYEVKNLEDGDFSTAWAPNAKGDGTGEWVECCLKDHRGRNGEYGFRGVRFANGYLKSEKAWADNSRIRQFRMEMNGSPVCYLNLKDSMFTQSVGFPTIMVKNGDVIRFTLTAIYPGKRFKDLCLTELVLDGAH